MAEHAHSSDTKAAVMAALMTGQSLGQAAREYNIPKSTVARWKKEAFAGQESGTGGTQKKEIGELVADYLRANLAALRAQAELFANKEWLEKQGASEVAVLHGVMTDKAMRLLEALGDREA